MNPQLADLQFIRPAWLGALLLLPVLAWAWRRRQRRRSAWRESVDAHLLPHLLDARAGRGGAGGNALASLCGLALAIVAAAGPSWRAVPQPMQAGGDALAIVLDLSSASLANDLQPSRLVQARAKIAGLLRAHAGPVALVAYADDAFVVSPVTPDPANVAVFLDALAPDVMPVDGSNAARGIELAGELLGQAGHPRGTILLLAPDAGTAAVRAAARAAVAGHRVDVLGMGTPAGGAYRGRDGAIDRSALDPAPLRAVAAAGGGSLHPWSASPETVLAPAAGGAGGGGTDGGLVPEDGGYWLLPLAMLLLLAGFRRGTVLASVALCLLLPLQPAFAGGAQPPSGDLWRRADQAAHQRSVAAEAAYRRGDFKAAAEGFSGLPGADAAYNRGNALARAGSYAEAIAAYDEALALDPGMEDARANRAAVEAAMRRQPPEGGAGGAGSGDEGAAGTAGEPAGGDGATDRLDPADAGDGAAPEAQSDAAPPAAEQAAAEQPAPGPPPPSADAPDADARAREQALEDAQRDAIERALEDGAAEEGAEPGPADRSRSTAEAEREQANAAWLRQVPDDPGALLRARFRNEHLRRRAGER
ncbi:MAG: tetratricopeptide repeat protein [Gammaproteobacteria bacterium]|nr:tetratricopeptide repeat protein [Gammaproteobacteria bacterium]